MKIRDGFVTNSSSTNFLIISKKELTPDYLLKKMGFKKNSPIAYLGSDLSSEILRGISRGVRWYDIDEIDYENIKEIFGEKSAEKYEDLSKRGCFSYVGHTGSDDSCLASFMTMDNFIIDEKDFYMNGLNCVW